MEVPTHALNFVGVLPVAGDDGILTDAAHRGKFPRGRGEAHARKVSYSQGQKHQLAETG